MSNQIVWARYGVREHGQWVDVREYLPLITPHRIGPDVFPEVPGTEGKERALWLDIVDRESQRRHFTFKDGEVFDLDGVVQPTSEKQHGQGVKADEYGNTSGLQIRSAHYGIYAADGLLVADAIDVTDRVQSLVQNDSLDIVVNNSTIVPGQNPFRGIQKVLEVVYAYGGGKGTIVRRAEKEALIIGQPQRREPPKQANVEDFSSTIARREAGISITPAAKGRPMSPTALNDFLLRRFNVSAYRLRAPQPIEVPSIHRNDIAALFGELGFKRGAEVGVAEGHFSEVLCQSIPSLEKLYCVDPWHRYSSNPQRHSKEHHEFALNETKRRLAPYTDRVELVQGYSMDAVRNIPEHSLDFVSIDGHHGFDFVMRDIIEWSYRVRGGGLILLDDFMYLDRKRWGAGVVEAVQAYTSAHEIRPWFLCQGHRSVDAFWVKP